MRSCNGIVSRRRARVALLVAHAAIAPLLSGCAAGTSGRTPSFATTASSVSPARTAPLSVSPDHHWLTFRGKPVVLVGDSITQGWMELGTDFDERAWIDALATRGINVLMLWSYIGITDQIADVRIGYDAPEIWPWLTTGGAFDLGRFNDAYFERLRSIVTCANSRDVAVLITVHDGWTKTRFAGHPFNHTLGGPLTDRSQYVELFDCDVEMPAAFDAGWNRRQKHQYCLERFCDRIIQATGDQPNVIYEMFNEGEWYNQRNLRAFQAHFLRFFKSRTPRVTVVNDDHVGGMSFHTERDCDAISLHSPNWTSSTSAAEAFRRYAVGFAERPAKPLLFTEPVPEYQGDASLHDAMMRLMWGTLLGGAGFVVQNDTSYGYAPRSAMAAQSACRDAVLDLEGHAARFFNASGVNFASMAPNELLASTGVCLANPGREYVVYAQSGTTVTLELPAATGDVTVRFYNPRTGRFQPAFTATGNGPRSFTKPDAADWVMHVTVPRGPSSG